MIQQPGEDAREKGDSDGERRRNVSRLCELRGTGDGQRILGDPAKGCKGAQPRCSCGVALGAKGICRTSLERGAVTTSTTIGGMTHI